MYWCQNLQHLHLLAYFRVKLFLADFRYVVRTSLLILNPENVGRVVVLRFDEPRGAFKFFDFVVYNPFKLLIGMVLTALRSGALSRLNDFILTFANSLFRLFILSDLVFNEWIWDLRLLRIRGEIRYL